MLVVVAVGVVILVKSHVFDGESKNITEQNTTNIVEKPEEKKDEEENKKIDEQVPKKEEIPQYDGDNPNMAEELSGVVSYAGVSGENLMIRVNIDQYLTSGNCALDLIRNGVTIYNMAAEIESSVATATCNGFNVPVAGLGPGKVEIKIILESEDKSGIITGEAEI